MRHTPSRRRWLHTASASLSPTTSRRGGVLILVLVVVMTVSFALYSFSERMLLQLQASSAALHQLQLRCHAESGIAIVCDRLQHAAGSPRATDLLRMGLSESPTEFSGCSVVTDLTPQWQPGVADEAGRLNLNGLSLEAEYRKATRQRLTRLPGMTSEIAAAILDWMDGDDDVSQFGAESQWYLAQQPAYRPRQSRLLCLDELLQIRGVTPALLYGEDRNRNAVADPGEDTNGDGRVDFGWSRWLTVRSRERLTRPDGRPRINLNADQLDVLYDAVKAELGEQPAKFIVGLRLRGPQRGAADRIRKLSEQDRIDERFASAQRRLAQQLGTGQPAGLEALQDSATVKTEVRDGITLTSPTWRFRSVLDLVDVNASVSIDNVDTLLPSPWSTASGGLSQIVQLLEDHFVCAAGDHRPARISLFAADYEVLRTIPGMTESLARAILAARATQRPVTSGRQNLGWFVERGLLTLRQLQDMGPYVTSHGDVWRGVAIGHSDRRPAGIAIAFVIDAANSHPTVVAWHQLPPLSVRTLLSQE